MDMIDAHVIALNADFTAPGQECSRLLSAVGTNSRLVRILADGFRKHYSFVDDSHTSFIAPEQYRSSLGSSGSITECDEAGIAPASVAWHTHGSWMLISNGRCITGMNLDTMRRLTERSEADVITVNVDPQLKSNREIARITRHGEILGIRRAFFDSIVPDYTPANWPNHTLIRREAFERIADVERLPLKFDAFLVLCASYNLSVQSVRVGGGVLDLESEAAILDFVAACLSHGDLPFNRGSVRCQDRRCFPETCSISPSARIFGQVILGERVAIDDDALIVGPVVIGDNARVGSAAAVYASLIGPRVSIPSGASVRRRVVSGEYTAATSQAAASGTDAGATLARGQAWVDVADTPHFRTWPLLSYARFGKRICDIVGATICLMVCAPVMIIVAFAVKLTSPGPVLFRHRREGLHGVEFDCVKFRTMIVGADEIQDRLRHKNDVDGPQFKVAKDPRVTRIGKFLRDTFLDELPQFINVLSGQMSMIGPRPSPRSENRLCASWRDARLSVKPGISGLWQVSRTRRSGQDFQEWIHYDIEYVRRMSFWQDVLICLRTVRQVVSAFIRRL
jgi:lipopolysaccharide/colanic/teichoic acid biosynthesis glycosyltransferase/carbonic anhydrase/acetyltransferase-like protein (isoleucine patch superfamily)